jgi:Fe-Mn family superoxide dismutase
MEIHHTKHHQAYIDKLNAVLEKYPVLAEKKLEDLLRELSSLPVEEADRTAIKNHGGGHLNHSLFWQIMGSQKEIDQELIGEIEKTFGSVDEFKKVFTQTAMAHFGSGWAWLARDQGGVLKVYSLPNQDSPYLKGHTPLIGLDIWEHAYYLKYQNRRQEYVNSWWSVLKNL